MNENKVTIYKLVFTFISIYQNTINPCSYTLKLIVIIISIMSKNPIIIDL